MPETLKIQVLSGSSSVCRFKGTNQTLNKMQEKSMVVWGFFKGTQSRVILDE